MSLELVAVLVGMLLVVTVVVGVLDDVEVLVVGLELVLVVLVVLLDVEQSCTASRCTSAAPWRRFWTSPGLIPLPERSLTALSNWVAESPAALH